MAPTSTTPSSADAATGFPVNAQLTVDSGFVGEEFSNNLFSDLAPLLTLFGERVTKQFLSMSLGWADNILLAVGPLGIITTIVSAIRVGNVRVLKALIGRAREKLATAELELLSSTSDETSELWTDGGVVRQPGHAQFVEMIAYRKAAGSQKSSTPPDIPMRDLSSDAGNEICAGDLGTLFEKGVIEKVNPKVTRVLGPLLKVLDFGLRPPAIEPQDLAEQSPNITLNIHKALASPRELWLFAALGMSMQVVALAIPAFMTYYWKEKKGNTPVEKYAYPLFLVGSCVLFVGIALCSHIVEATTVEQTFRLKRPYVLKTIFRLQMECKMGDQNFDSYVLISDADEFQIRTSRISSRHGESDAQRISHARRKKVIWLAVLLSLSGFICQFVGLRALHWSATITQLGVTLIMTAIRALVRRGISLKPRAIRLSCTDFRQVALSLGHACLSDWPENSHEWPKEDPHSLRLFKGHLKSSHPREVTQYADSISPEVVSLEDPRIELEHKMHNFTSPGRVETDAMASKITLLTQEFHVSLTYRDLLKETPQHYHWQHLIQSKAAPNSTYSYHRLSLCFHVNKELEIIWNGGKSQLDALFRLWDHGDDDYNDSEMRIDVSLLCIQLGKREELDSRVESYAYWTGRKKHSFERCPLTYGAESDPKGLSTPFAVFGMSLEHVRQESLEPNFMGEKDCLYTAVICSRLAMHALEVLSGFLHVVAEKLGGEHNTSNWTKQKNWQLQEGLFSLSRDIVQSGIVSTEEDAKVIVFPPFLRRDLLPSRPLERQPPTHG